MKLGYARVSTKGQDTTAQETALTKDGCEKLFVDVASGAKEHRPQLARMLELARTGDTIVIWKLDRLARSLRHLIDLSAMFADRGIALRSLTDAIDTGTASGELTFHMLAALAQFERALIVERVQAGLARARAQGRRGGRKSATHSDHVGKLAKARALMADGLSVREACRVAGICRATVYKYGKQEGIQTPENRPSKQTHLSNGHAESADAC